MTVLFDYFPALRGRVPWVSLGALPTRVDDATRVLSAAGLPGELWLKRDDLSSSVYGGNKLRLLEHLLAEAQQRGATCVYSSGPLGSNFAVATALHAPRIGLAPGAICFPEPLNPEGEQSHRVVQARARVVEIAHRSLLPVAAERVRRQDEQQGQRVQVLSQVSLSPEALFGYVAAGLELAQQAARGECPAPSRVVLPIGSAATSAGILAGLSLGRKLGIGRAAPSLCAVRIAAWPLSRRGRVLSLAVKALARLADLCGDPSLALGKRELLPVSVITDQLGSGYPHPTPAGTAARAAFAEAGLAILDDTYSAKAAAHLLASAASNAGPLLFWCTKSSAPLP
jgi:1-aminocyclopropane-1-carboxylate deaminase/D-cysteine desulfhydrase-like pyridoxal-dependent ACC family enzyme